LACGGGDVLHAEIVRWANSILLATIYDAETVVLHFVVVVVLNMTSRQ